MGNKYLFKLWLLTLVLTPFVYSIYETVTGSEGQMIEGWFEFLPIILLFAFVFSLPTLLVIYIVNNLISTQGFSKSSVKRINVLLALVGIVCTLLLIQGSLVIQLMPIYIIGVVISAVTIELFERIKVN